ncbi:MAG: apolipoprotein N-acyltransferase [Candidatus Schekmanbacteria bacterium RBG_13_48_7]|uniref:Apolipoprotein N-acyltransferase n=1 Tax=Candidatus Schekmanbacteria bacterium RBG_13_48_7 TaxID=1817878 RepID=A0A1F7RR72_9BACT|nr:MAG: apolipoprotein N-acyltransferase [Candidatus Schekmanbacteria bacterium RBG_13_48_7]
MGCVFVCLCSHWLIGTLVSYGDMPLEIAYGIYSLMVLSLALYYGFFCFFISYAKQKWGTSYYMTAPALMVFLEWIRGYNPVGFPWNNLGYSLYNQTVLIQIADITSVYGLTYWIILTNCALYEIFFEKIHQKYNYNPLIAVLCFFLLFMGYGVYRTNEKTQFKPVTIAVLQGNIGIDKKWDPEFRDRIIDIYKDLTEAAADPDVDLIVWPEASLPVKLKNNYKLQNAIFDLAHETRKYLLIGSVDYDPKTGNSYNAAFLISPERKITNTYYKMRLVPFGEYVPWSRIFFFIDKITDAYGDFYPGTNPAVMSIDNKFRASIFICYETVFPALLRKFAANGAQVLINITNDAWFGLTDAPYQHFSFLTFRAIENRVPIARSANTGISGFIDSSGHILEMTEIATKTLAKKTLFLDNRISFYCKYGDIFVYCCVGLLLYYYIRFKYHSRKSKSIN